MENKEDTSFFDGQENNFEFNNGKILLPQDARLGFFEQAEQRAKGLPKFESADSQYSKMVELYRQNKKLNTADIAKAKAYAEKYGYDPAVVYNNIKNLDDAEKSWKLEFFAKNTQDNPITGKYMADAKIQPYIKDDYENMGLWERYVKSIYNGVRTSYYQARMNTAALSLAKKEINGEDTTDILRKIEQWREALATMPQRNKKEKAFFSGSWMQQAGETGSQVAASMMPGAATGAAGGALFGPEGAAAGAIIGGIISGFASGFTLEGGGAYLQYRELTDENGKKISPKAAAKMAAEVGVMNGVIEAAGDTIIVGKVLTPSVKMAKKMAVKPLEKWFASEGTVKLLEKSPLMKKAAEKILSKPEQFQKMTPAAALKKAAAAVAESEAGEVSQEFLQEFITGAGEEALKAENFLTQSAAAARIKTKYGFDYKDIEDNLDKMSPEDRTIWLNAKKSVAQILKQSSDVILPTLIGTAPFALLGGAGTYYNANIAAERSRALELAGQKAADEQSEQALAQMHSNIVVSQTNPKAAAVIMQDLAEDVNVPTTYVKREKFYQVISAGVEDFTGALEQADLKQEWENAQNNDTDFVEIPTGKWLNLRKQITGNMQTVYEQLKNDIKFKVDGYTTNEILETREKAVEQAKSALDKILKEDTELKDTAEFFEAQAAKQFTALPKPEGMSEKEWDESKQAYITLACLYAVRTAKRKGLSSEEAVQNLHLPKIQVQLSKRQQELKDMAEMFADDVSGDIDYIKDAEVNEGQSTTPITDAVISAGGIKIKGHKSESDFENFTGKESGIKGLINNNSGITPEEMAYRVFEGGEFAKYFNETDGTSPDVNMLLAALEDERGKYEAKSDRVKATKEIRSADESLDMTSEEWAEWYEKKKGIKLPKGKELKQLYRFYIKAMADRGTVPTQRALREYGLTAEDLTEQGDDLSFDFGENTGGGYSGEVAFQFGGPKAENADTLALGKAKEMEQSGTDRETIRRQTGWFKGADGKWRFEISDKEAEILPSALEHFAKYLAAKYESSYAYRESEELRQNPTKYKPEVQKELIKIYENNLKKANKEMFELGDELRLGDILKHDKLFKAYPYLRDVKITVSDMDASGSYYPDYNEIVLDADMFDARKHKYNKAYPQETRTAEIKKVLMHEIQHAIQEKEGFAKGGNPEQFADRARQAEIKRDLAKLKEREQAGEDVSEEIAQAEFELNSIKEGQTDKYLHLAGEMEARNTERRANMSDQERQDTAPQDTQDYKDSDAIVVFGDGTALAYNQQQNIDLKSDYEELKKLSFDERTKKIKGKFSELRKQKKFATGEKILKVLVTKISQKEIKWKGAASDKKLLVHQTILLNLEKILKRAKKVNEKEDFSDYSHNTSKKTIEFKKDKAFRFFNLKSNIQIDNKPFIVYFKVARTKNVKQNSVLLYTLWFKPIAKPHTMGGRWPNGLNKDSITNNNQNNKFFQFGGPQPVDLTGYLGINNNLTKEEALSATETKLQSLIDEAIDTATPPLQIQIIDSKTEHILNGNLKLKGNQVRQHNAAIFALEDIVHNAVKTKEKPVDLTHNGPKTIERKKLLDGYVYFSAPAKIEIIDNNGNKQIVDFDVELMTEKVSGQDENLLDLYHIRVKKRTPAATQLSALQTGSSTNSITNNRQNDKYDAFLGSFEGGEEPVITLGEKANFSTLLHEFAHFLHYDMKRALAEKPDNRVLAQEIETLRKWYSGSYKFVVSEIAKDPRYSKEEKEQILKTIKERGGEKYITEVAYKEQTDKSDAAESAVRYQFEELFARGFEKYLQTGKAPVAKLNGLFARVRKWMLKVYKRTGLPAEIELNEEIVNLFDALIVADETIDTWFKSPRIKEAATQGLFADIKDERIREELKAELFAILKNDIEAKKKLNIGQVRKRAKENAEKFIKNSPEYKALNSVRFGLKGYPQNTAQDFLEGKLSRNDRFKFEGIYRQYADIFTSSLDMARKLAQLPNSMQYVQQAQENAEREALELAINNPEKLQEFVREIVSNNQKNMELGLLELKYIEERLNSLGNSKKTKIKPLTEREDAPQLAKETESVKPVKLSLIKKFGSFKELKDYLFSTLEAEEITIQSTGQRVLFSQNNIRRALKKGRSKVNNSLYPKAKTVVSQALYGGFEVNDGDPKHASVKGQDIYYTAIEADGKVYAVEVRIDVPLKDKRNGLFDYAGHKSIYVEEIKTPSTRNQPTAGTADSANIEGNISIARFKEIFNRAYDSKEKQSIETDSRLYLTAMKNRFKTMAAEYIRGKVLRQAGNINAYYRKAMEAGAKAAVYFESGDIYGAYDYKIKQLQFLAIAAEAIRVSKQTEKYKQYLNDLRKEKNFKNTYEFEQVADLLRRFGFARRDFTPNEKRQTLETYINNKVSSKVIDTRPELAEFILDEKTEKKFKDLTFEELEDIIRALKFIQKAATAEDKFDVLAEKAEIRKITELAVEALDKNFTAGQKDKNQKEIDEKPKGIYKWIDAVKGLFGTLKELATIVYKLDGGNDGGLFAQLFLEPVAVCADNESKIKRNFSEKLLAAAKKSGGEEYLQECLAQTFEFDGGGFVCNKLNLIMLALNWGNLSNRRVLKAVPPHGYKGDMTEWQENADIILEYEFKRHLSAADWQFIQSVWNALEDVGKEQFKVEERVRGFAPKKVEPYGFTIDTADGKKTYLSGGYFPLMMDRRTVRGRTISAEEELGEKIRKAYHTDRGAMMKRTGAVYPVSLEFTDLAREVDQSIHDICFRELVNDYNRLMRKRLFAEYLRLCAGKSDFDKIGEYIDFLAGGTREYNRITGMDGIVNWLRKGFTISTLTLNAGVIVQNLSNPFTLENVVDGFGKAEVFKTVLYAAKMMPCVLAGTKEGREFKEFVYSKSQMMKDREQTNDIIFEQVREYDTLEGGNILEKNNNRLMDFSNWIFNASDNITMLPAWYVAYEQGINELKLSENKAVLRADDVVKKTVGSGRKYDVSSIQRNKQVLARMITPFMTFFNKELNKVIRETYRDYHKKDFGRMAWFYFQKFVLFAALSELLALRPPEEDEPWWKWMLESGVSFAAGLTPFTRELPSLVLNGLLGFDGYYGSSETAVESAIKKAFYKPLASGFSNTAKTIGLKEGEADWQKFAEDVAGSTSVFMPYPNVINSIVFNMIDIYNDEMDFKTKDLIRRRPKKEKK